VASTPLWLGPSVTPKREGRRARRRCSHSVCRGHVDLHRARQQPRGGQWLPDRKVQFHAHEPDGPAGGTQRNAHREDAGEQRAGRGVRTINGHLCADVAGYEGGEAAQGEHDRGQQPFWHPMHVSLPGLGRRRGRAAGRRHAFLNRCATGCWRRPEARAFGGEGALFGGVGRALMAASCMPAWPRPSTKRCGSLGVFRGLGRRAAWRRPVTRARAMSERRSRAMHSAGR
jgi:hypothetical protein